MSTNPVGESSSSSSSSLPQPSSANNKTNQEELESSNNKNASANESAPKSNNNTESRVIAVDESSSSNSVASSCSSNEKLKIDVSDDNEAAPVVEKKDKPAAKTSHQPQAPSKQHTNGNSTSENKPASQSSEAKKKPDENESKSPSKSVSKSPTKTPKEKPQTEKEPNEEAASDSKADTSTASASSSKKRRVDRGLDGGYWSRVAAEPVAEDTSHKRRRTTTDRFDLTAYTKPLSASYIDSSSSINDDSSGDDAANVSIHSESTQGSKSANTSASAKDRFTLFKTKSFLAVLNDEGGFFLCQATHGIYEDSKKCKIQWLEEAADNRYKFGYVDWIDPATIVARVKMRRNKDHLMQIDESDLKRVNELVQKALKEGGITVDFENNDQDGRPKTSKKSNKDILNDAEFYDKESSSDKEEAAKKKPAQPQSSSKSEIKPKPVTTSGEKPKSSVVIEKTEKPKPKPVESKDSNQVAKKVESKDVPKKPPQPSSSNNGASSKPPLVKPSPNGDKIAKKKVIESDDSDDEEFRKKKKTTSSSTSGDKKTVKKVAKKSIQDEDTDEIDSEPEKPQPKDPRLVKQQAAPQASAKQQQQQPVKQQQAQTSKSATAESAAPSAVSSDGLLVKKRRLDKALSNRHLQENSRVETFVKDPFFEQDGETPFVSPLAHSKLAFRAVYLNDGAFLKSLIDDVDRVLSVHVGRSIAVNETPAQLAVQLNNRRMLEILIDDFLNSTPKKRVQMPESMFNRFSTGVYNPRSMGGIPFVRRLTESRGAKEGNQAFTKDNDLVEYCGKNSRWDSQAYFKKLFQEALESGCSPELFDFLFEKFKSTVDNKRYNTYDMRFIYDLIIRALLNGHRHLAAHVIGLNAAMNGFNSVHIEVLKADADQELKCQLRAIMCTKKAFANDQVTPIHCACINPNVKYLKTLLSITQDFNISDRRGRRPVHYAAVCEGPTPLEYLISRVSPYDLDTGGNTPLHFACQSGRSINVEILLNYAQAKLEEENAFTVDSEIHNKFGLGAINKPNKTGRLPLHLAISKNNYDCVKVLLKYGCNLEYPLPNSLDKITPLMYACRLGHFKLVKLLVENNAKVSARDRFWRTAVMHAAMCGHTNILSYLLRLGADPNVADSSGNTALHYSCAYGWYHATKSLIEAGARVNAVNDWKLTPFGAAFLKGHVGICEQLHVWHKDQIDVNFRTDDGETLVMLALSASSILNEASVSQLDYIINKLGGNATLIDSYGNNAFHYLAGNPISRVDVERANAGSDEATIDAKLREQEQLRIRMAECLIKAKCSATLENNNMETPLIRALNCLNARFARYLLGMKANKEVVKLEKSFLAVLTEKCLDMDACAVILGDKYDSYDIFNKFKGEFQRMASQKDDNGLTPFQLACSKLREHLEKTANDENNNKGIPASLMRFILFLHKECKSNPNEPVYKKSSHKRIEASTNNNNNDDDDSNDQEDSQSSSSSTSSSSASSSSSVGSNEDRESVKIKFFPIFKLVSDRCVSLIESLVKQSNSTADINSISFNVYNSEGLTPLLEAIVKSEHNFANKLIDLGLFNKPSELRAQISRNSSVYRKENVLQLLVRNSQTSLITKVLRVMSTSPSELVKLIEHQNTHGQNFIHTLSLCQGGGTGACQFTASYLTQLFADLKSTLAATNPDTLAGLLSSRDLLGRNPVHFCLLTSGLSRSSKDLELFFVEDVYTIVENARVGEIFTKRDCFDRLPIHYLFYNTFNWPKDEEMYKTAVADGPVHLLKSIRSVELPSNTESVTVMDPVELLSLIINQTKKSGTDSVDQKDMFGYTTMHYAAIRGSSVCLSLFLSQSCDFLARARDNNTPLSSAVYFKRSSCVQTLLRVIEEKNSSSSSSSNDLATTLNDFYYLPASIRSATSSGDDEKCMKWLGARPEADLFTRGKIQIYELILSYDWEGLSWLVLQNLPKFSLTRVDSIRWAITAQKYNLALRLIEKLKRDSATTNPIEAYEALFKPSKDDSNRTLLHLLARAKLSDKSLFVRILESLLVQPATNKQNHLGQIKQDTIVKDFLEARDVYGTTALHYAFYMHNFTLIDFVFSFLESNQMSGILPTTEQLMSTCKDSQGQSAYSLVYWQIGRINYSQEIKDNIKRYSAKYLTTTSRLESTAKACFPRVQIPNFASEDSVSGRFVDDYPIISPSTTTTPPISPLLYAITRQSFDMCKFLIKTIGFDVNTTDASGQSALVYAIRVNNINLCHLLMNTDYEPKANLPVKPQKAEKKAHKAGFVMQNLFVSMPQTAKTRSAVQAVPAVPAAPAVEDEDENMEEEEENDDEEEDTHAMEVDHVVEKSTTASQQQVRVKTNLALNHLDEKSRTVFHHLACSLDYGSFRNIDIAKLLFAAFQYANEHQPNLKLPLLADFLKRVDSNVKSACDYALKNGNIELFEEFKRQLNKSAPPPKLTPGEFDKFSMGDTFFNPAIKVDYAKDSETFLNSVQSTTSDQSAVDKDYFKVDPASNMHKIGRLVWDKKFNVPYDVILTKTDVSYGLYGIHNFYKIQLITHSYTNEEDKQQQVCVLFTRWGRIGDQGQCQRTPFASLAEAKDEFAKLFKQKTGNDFVDTVLEKKKPFESKPRRYTLVRLELRRRPKLKDIDFTLFDATSTSVVAAVFGKSMFAKLPQQQADDFKNFWTELLDVAYLKSRIHNNSVLSADYIPLTQLSSESIRRAYEILDRSLKPLIERRMELEKLSIKENLTEHMTILEHINRHSNEFYELIPQMNYNYEKLKPIANEAELDAQICALNQLSNAQLACRILMGARSAQTSMNPFEYVYRAVECRLQPMAESDIETQYLLKYCWANAADENDGENRPKVMRIFKFDRPGEQERFNGLELANSDQMSKLKNRFLLWHGTSTENMLSIMCKGLRIAPNDAASNGQRFGKGIYFSDSFSFSQNYSRGRRHRQAVEPQNFMLLCEVALGKSRVLRTNHESLDATPPDGFDSVKALGRLEPDPMQNVSLPNGCIIPLGNLVPTPLEAGENLYSRSSNGSQYVVYKEAQCCIRYIVQFKSDS